LNTRLLSWQEGRAIGLGSAFPQKNSTVVTQGTTVIHSYIQDCVTNDDAIKSEEREKYH